MNSIWNKNIKLFTERFPILAQNYGFVSEFSAESASSQPQFSSEELLQDLPEELVAPIEILPSKQNLPTAKENGKFLHSMYNPLREAEQAAVNAKNSSADICTCAFFSVGLGYAANAYARNFPDDTIIIIENDIRYFFSALANTDWSDVFAHKKLVIALQTKIESIIQLLEHCGGIPHCAICEVPAQSEHASDYFSALHSLIQRNKRKHQLNNSTLEKFSNLWMRNSCRNLHYLAELDGVNIYEDNLSKEKNTKEIPAVILAAGPTLQEILPHLKEIKKRAVIIAVDTALRATLKAGVEPDFIILADPQYYAYRHISGLKSPSSVLITESAAYPSVFRFQCRKIVMCSSLFPIGKYIESKIGTKGELSAGGSVSTTAWDFARLIGVSEIFISGLDLGYPQFHTHIKGSTFEEKMHMNSLRLIPAETSGCASLFGANMEWEEDYEGNKILTDNKMKMFSWWFESRQEEFKDKIKTYSLSSKSLRIPGFKTASPQELLSRPSVEKEKKHFFESSETQACDKTADFQELLSQLKNGFEELHTTAKKGLQLAQTAIIDKKKVPQYYMEQLSAIDKKILASEFKDIAALVFPTERKLNEIFENFIFNENPLTANFQRSKILYEQLIMSIKNYQKKLFL